MSSVVTKCIGSPVMRLPFPRSLAETEGVHDFSYERMPVRDLS